MDFSSSVANSRSRAFRQSICAQEKSPRIYTRVHSGGFELTKLTYTRLEDNLIRHRGDQFYHTSVRRPQRAVSVSFFAYNGCACCTFGGSRLSATSRTKLWRLSAKCNATNPLGRGFVAREARVARGERTKHRASTQRSTAIQQLYSLTPAASRMTTKSIKSTRLTIRRRPRRIQWRKFQSEQVLFQLMDPTV